MNINFNRKRRDPEREGQMKVRYAPGKRNLANLKWRLTLLIVLSPFIYFLGKLFLALFVAPASGFVMLDTHQYQCPADGMVREFHVEVGQQVDKQQLLLVVEDYELDRKIEEIRNQIDTFTETHIDNAKTENYYKEQVNFAREALTYQEKQFSDIDFLFRQGAATVAEHSTANNLLIAAKTRLSAREHEYQQWLNTIAVATPHEGSVGLVKGLRKKLEALEEEQERLSLYSLSSGQVTEVFVAEGQLVKKAEPAVIIAKKENPMVLAYIEPKNIKRVQSGETAQVELPSGRVIMGRVQSNPGVTGRLPSYLSSPMLGRQRMIVVYLQPLEPFPDSEMVDGLPVKVHFRTSGRRVLDRLLSLFS